MKEYSHDYIIIIGFTVTKDYYVAKGIKIYYMLTSYFFLYYKLHELVHHVGMQ